jgi:hypothetical protein
MKMVPKDFKAELEQWCKDMESLWLRANRLQRHWFNGLNTSALNTDQDVVNAVTRVGEVVTEYSDTGKMNTIISGEDL